MSLPQTVTLSLTRATKGAVLYNNVRKGDDEAVTNIYLRKVGLDEPFPATITMTIEVKGE